MNLPNLISLIRLGLVPVFVALYLGDRPMAALVVFASAAASDALDGFLARALDQRTPLGAILDPLADKLLGFSALVLLALDGLLPFWLLGLSILRDVVVLGFGLSVRSRVAKMTVQPTRISKYATFSVMTTVVMALVYRIPESHPALAIWTAVAAAIAAQCLAVAALQYAVRWRRWVFAGAPAEV